MMRPVNNSFIFFSSWITQVSGFTASKDCITVKSSTPNKVLDLSSFELIKASLSDLYIQNICHDAKCWKGQLAKVCHILMTLSGSYSPLSYCLSVSRSLWGEIPEIWIRIAPQRIHDLISMCHSDLIGLDTAVEDLKGLKASLFHSSVYLPVIGGDNEALAAEMVEQNHLNLKSKEVCVTYCGLVKRL